MREMKDSGVEWIGEIPKNWKVVRGKYVLQLLDRAVDEDSDVITCFRDGEVTLRTKRREEGFTFSLKEIGYQGIRKGDLVIHGMDGFAGAIGVSDSDGKGSPVLVVCDSNENKEYISYFLRALAYMDVFLSLSTGIRERSCDLGWRKISDLLFVIPPREEQDRIAHLINDRCAQIDRAIARQQEVIEKLKEYKLSVITEAVTKGLNPDVPMKDSGIEWIGEIPEHWEISKVKYVAQLQPKCSFENIRPETPITYAPMECIKQGYFISNETNFGELSTSLNAFEEGDIVLAKVTPCFENGNVANMTGIKSGIGLGSSELFVFRPTEINTKYLLYWLQNDFFKQMGCATMTGTGGLKRVSPYFIANCEIHLPPRREQEAIVEGLDKVCLSIDKATAQKLSIIEKLTEYKKSLIYEVVTGKREV